VYGSSGGAGPVRSPDPDPIAAAVGGAVNSTDTTYDPNLTYKLAGTIILALVTVFILQASGFRFVGAASFGVGRS
jgi:hypothetical protein